MNVKDKVKRIADRYTPMIINDLWEVELQENYLRGCIEDAIFNAMSKEDYAKLSETNKDQKQ